MYVGYMTFTIRCPKLTSLLHSYYKVSSSTCPSCRLVKYARPDNLLAINKSANIHLCSFPCCIGPSKWIHAIHWSREFSRVCVIPFANVCDYVIILDYLILLNTWNRCLQKNMEGNSGTLNTRDIKWNIKENHSPNKIIYLVKYDFKMLTHVTFRNKKSASVV